MNEMSLDDEELALFRNEMRGVKKLQQDRVNFQRATKSPQAQLRRDLREQQDTLFYFSDEYEPLLSDEGTLKYLREGEDPYLLKQLRRGDFSPQIFLDLHGLTREQAKQELAALIQVCEREHLYCASVMTGYGTFTLKRQIPRWLVQHPKVRALHQAPKEWGGDAAILFLLDA